MRKLDVNNDRLIVIMTDNLANAQINRGKRWDKDQYREFKINETILEHVYFSDLPAKKDIVFEFYKKLRDEAPELNFQNSMKEFEDYAKIIINKILAHFC